MLLIAGVLSLSWEGLSGPGVEMLVEAVLTSGNAERKPRTALLPRDGDHAAMR